MPTPQPTPGPTTEATPGPTLQPTPQPTPIPTPLPTLIPSPLPTPFPTNAPTPNPTPQPTIAPIPRLPWSQLGQDLDGPGANDLLGSSLAISSNGQILAVGAPTADTATRRSGLVRIFRLSNSQWVRLGSDLPGTEVSAMFGGSVSLSSDGLTVAAGARFQNFDTGLTKVYRWSGVDWVQLGNTLAGTTLGDEFGASVSLNGDGNMIAVGSPRRTTSQGASAGVARVFTLQNNIWIQVGSDMMAEAGGDLFGETVRISFDGTRVAVAAPQNGLSSRVGQVRVYNWNGIFWSQIGADIDGEASGDFFGTSLDMSDDGQVIAAGSPFNDGNGNRAGHVRVFRWQNNQWLQLGSDIDGETGGDESGVSVSLSPDGNSVAVGAERNFGIAGIRSGHVRVFEFVRTDWVQVGMDIDGELAEDQSGTAVALANNNVVAIGAPSNDGAATNAGQARVFLLSTSTLQPTPAPIPIASPVPAESPSPEAWSQVGESVRGGATGDRAGDSVAISGDGNLVAIASTFGNSPEGLGDVGSVRVFRRPNPSSVVWIQVGQTIYGELRDDLFGYSLALSKDGIFLAVGSHFRSSRNGFAAVYRFIGNAWTQVGPSFEGDNAEELGYALDLSSDGSILAIGSPQASGTALGSGLVRVFRREGSNWLQVGSNLEGEISRDRAGISVALNGDGGVVAFGSIESGFAASSLSDSGYVVVYQLVGSDWQIVGDYVRGVNGGDRFGVSVALSEDGTIFAGGGADSDGTGTDSGQVRVFEVDGGAWSQVGQSINGEASFDESGRWIDLSADGQTVAIGAVRNDAEATSSRGHVRIYQNTNSVWTQIGNDIDGLDSNEDFGRSVKLSADGRVVAAGAPRADNAGTSSGEVRVYDWN